MKCCGYILWLYCLLQLHGIVATSGEVDALAQAANEEAYDEYCNKNTSDGECLLVHVHEADIVVLQEVARDAGCEVLVQPLVLSETVLVDKTCEVNGCKE